MQIARHLCWWFVQNLNLRGRLSWGRCSMTLAHAGWAHSDLLLFNFGRVRFICKSGPPLLSSPLIGRGQRDLVCEVVIYSNLMHCPQIGEWACLPRPACLRPACEMHLVHLYLDCLATFFGAPRARFVGWDGAARRVVL